MRSKLIRITIVLTLLAGIHAYTVNSATILTTNSTDTIGTFRTNTNTNFTNLNNEVSSTTSALGKIASLSSSTGNLIVGSSSNWLAKTVGTDGTVLTASSTAQGGVSWETVATAEGFSTSTAHEWSARQTFNGGVSGTSTLLWGGDANASGTLSVGGSAVSTATGANPTVSIGLTAANGTLNTFLRSDSTPALSQAIVPTWTGLHTFSDGLLVTTIGPVSATSTLNLNTVNASTSVIDNLTAGTLTISSVVSGDMTVNNGDVNLASSTKAFRIGGTSVLDSTTLGSGITGSSLTSLGTITSLSAGSGIFSGLLSTNTFNVTSTSVFGSTISGTAGIFSGVFSVQTLNVTGTATLANLDVTNADEYRKHTASVVVMNPDTTNHATGTVFFAFPVDATILSLRCHSRPSGTSTIAVDRRASSTPATAGQAVLASQECGSSAVVTSFTTSTVMAGYGLNFTFNPVAGTPSSTVIYVDYRNND